MTNRIAGEDTILTGDFTKSTGRPMLTDSGNVDVLLNIMQSPSTLRIVVVAIRDFRRVQLEQIVLGNDLMEALRVITSPHFYGVVAQGVGCPVERFGSFIRVQVVPLLEQKRRSQEAAAAAIRRADEDRRNAREETVTMPVIVPVGSA